MFNTHVTSAMDLALVAVHLSPHVPFRFRPCGIFSYKKNHSVDCSSSYKGQPSVIINKFEE